MSYRLTDTHFETNELLIAIEDIRGVEIKTTLEKLAWGIALVGVSTAMVFSEYLLGVCWLVVCGAWAFVVPDKLLIHTADRIYKIRGSARRINQIKDGLSSILSDTGER